MNIDFFPLITSQFVAKDDSIIKFQLFDRNVADVEDRYSPMSPGMSEYYGWFHADWRMPAEEPIVIEWSGDKKETIIGSICTVTIVSPYDGALQPLYTTDARQYCCLISRKAYGDTEFSPVWFGWLDPEFYEEPFTDIKDYEVTLTFSDFGPLKRLVAQQPFAQVNGRFTLYQMINCALAQIDPSAGTYSTSDDGRFIQYVSTTLGDGTLIGNNNDENNNRTAYTMEAGATKVIGGLQVRFDNFTDEDGKTMTWYDVLEAVLRPLSLRIEQRAGQYYVYDLNALFVRSKMFDCCVLDGQQIHDTSVYPFMWWKSSDYKDWPEVMPGEIAPEGWAVELTHDSPRVRWESNDQMFSVDKTYNNVRITFSPYAETTLFDGEKVSFTIDQTFAPILNGYDYDNDEKYESFLLHLGGDTPQIDGITLGSGIYPFEIESLQGGSDCRGVVAFLGDIEYVTGNPEYWHMLAERDLYADSNHYNTGHDESTRLGRVPTKPTSAAGASALYTTRRIWIPNAYGNSKLKGRNQVLKIQIPMLYSEKYNPWEQSVDGHNSTYTKYFRSKANSAMLQIRIRLYSAKTGGSPLYYYQNYAWGSRGQLETNQSRMNNVNAGWKPANASQDLPTLIHYCKFDGSKVASEDISFGDGMADGGEPFNNSNETSYYFRKNFDGIYIPLPYITDSNAQAGYWLELEVTDGLYLYDKGNMFDSNAAGLFGKYCSGPINNIGGDGSHAYEDGRWWLVGFPTIKMVQNNRQIYDDIEIEDIEQSGVIDTNAAEELSVDTICGCCDMPFAKGAYIKCANGQPVSSLRRGTRTDSVEQLLIGTIYSQYAGRHLQLSGTAKSVLPLQGLSMLTDTHYPGMRFLVTQETYNVIDGESEITMTEVSEDSYTSQ